MNKYFFVLLFLVVLLPVVNGFGYDLTDEGLSISTITFTGNLTNLSQMQDTNFAGLADNDIASWDAATGFWIVGAPIAGAEVDPFWSVNYTLYNDSWTLNTQDTTWWSNWSFYNTTWSAGSTWDANWTAYNTTWSAGSTWDANWTAYNTTWGSWAANYSLYYTIIESDAINDSINNYILDNNNSVNNYITANNDSVNNYILYTNGTMKSYVNSEDIRYNDSASAYTDSKLITKFYNATNVNPVTGTPAGTVVDLRSYDSVSYNVSEDASDLELIINFTGITEFNQFIVRHKSSADESHLMIISLWNYDDLVWETYDNIGNTENEYVIRTQFVYDADEHISGGVVQLRFYIDGGTPARTHLHQFDWVVISSGPATPSAEETDPFAIHSDGNIPFLAAWGFGPYNISGTGNITADYFFGNGSQLTDIPDTTYTAGTNMTLAGGAFSWDGSWAESVFAKIVDLLSYVRWDVIWSQVYNETEVDAINVSVNNYIAANNVSVNNYIASNNDSVVNYVVDSYVLKSGDTMTGNLTINGNLTLEFGDLVSEQNPDGADAIRLKGTADDVDIVLGDITGYFSVWNSVDDTAVFMIDDRGDTDIAGELTLGGNLDLTALNISTIDCLHFDSGGMICSGV